MTIAFLFPGQGSQSEGLLHQLPQHAEVTRTIKEASDVLGRDIDALDSAESLHSTAAVQTSAVDRRGRHGTRPDGRTGSSCCRRRHVNSAPLAQRSSAARCPLLMPCRSSACAAN